MREILGLTGPRTEHTRGEHTYNRLFPHSPFDSKIMFFGILVGAISLTEEKIDPCKSNRKDKKFKPFFLICIYFNI